MKIYNTNRKPAISHNSFEIKPQFTTEPPIQANNINNGGGAEFPA
jgi:hypothetical protein